MIRNVIRRLERLEERKAPRQLWYSIPELLPDVLASLGRSDELPAWLALVGPHYDQMRPILERDRPLADALLAETRERTGFWLDHADFGL